MCTDKKARMVIKQQAGVPTVPVSADHRNGDWITTDIYEGEFAMDTDTGIVYTRSSAGIVTAAGDALKSVYRVLISQTGVLAPTVVESVNTIGAIVWTYNSIGYYIGTLAGAFPQATTFTFIGTGRNNSDQVLCYRSTDNVIHVKTFTAGAAADVLLSNVTLLIEVDQ